MLCFFFFLETEARWSIFSAPIRRYLSILLPFFFSYHYIKLIDLFRFQFVFRSKHGYAIPEIVNERYKMRRAA